jgi:hypothetical protein
MLKVNPLGGVYIDNKAAIDRAKAADLITLPKNIQGTNCLNCKFVSLVRSNYGYCMNPKVKQNVNNRMCCALWSAHGQWEAWNNDKKD